MIMQPVNYSPVPSVSTYFLQTVEDRPMPYSLNDSLSTSNVIILNVVNRSGAISTENVREFKEFKEFNELVEQAPWVVDFLKSASMLNNVKLLLPFYMEINKLIAQHQFDICNQFLKQVRVNELSDVLLVGLLRLTFLHKEKLPHWKLLLNNSDKELTRRKHDSHSLLKGLI
ncbi:hypothetical protein BCS42_07255 [Crenothrix sp. D3]|nr:hypothetical protein BCS42_07255 [Crenothrix sp. D3]